MKISFALSLNCPFTLRYDFLAFTLQPTFFLLLQGVTNFLSDSTIPMSFKSAANATCLEASLLSISFDFLLSYERGVISSTYIAIAVESPCVVVSSSDLLIDHLNVKVYWWRIAVVDIHWFWWAKYLHIMKKHLPIYCVEGGWCVYHEYCLCFLYWTFRKRHEYCLCFLRWTFHKRHEHCLFSLLNIS